VVEVITVYTIFADELLEYPLNDEVMKLGQAQGQRLQWRRCQIDIKGAPTCISRSQAFVQIPCSSHSTVQVPSSYGFPPPPPPPPQSPHVPSPHPEGTQNISSPPTPSPEKTEKLASPHPQETPNIPSPPPHPPPPSPPHETTKPTPPNGSAQNNHAKVGTSGPNTSVIGSGETPLGKKALEKPSAISKLQEEKLAKNNSSTAPTAGKQALKKPSLAISKQQEKEIAINKTSKRPTRKRSKRNTKENRQYMTNPKQSESDTEKNPWAMANPNYKFGKNILSDDDLKKSATW
jgi:hypothetical protein